MHHFQKIRFDDGTISYVPAVIGSTVGSKVKFGLKSEIMDGNVISIQNIPDGTVVCNVEKQFGDGGSFIKSAGSSATVFSHGDEGVKTKTSFWKIYNSQSKKSSYDRKFSRRWC